MRYFLFILFFCNTNLNAQLFEDFSDGNFSLNPTWEGDTNDFVVNEDKKLQLMAQVAGNSLLHTNISYPDSFSFTFNLQLEFSPSNTNNIRIPLSVTLQQSQITDGYYLSIGENGNLDALELYQVSQGNSTLVKRGIDGRFNASSNYVKIRITKRKGQIKFETALDESDQFEEEFNWQPTLFPIASSSSFGLYCTYTESRKDKFQFDDFNLSEYQPDLESPKLIEIVVNSRDNLTLKWDEAIDSESLDIDNVKITSQEAEILTLITNSQNQSNIEITLSDDLLDTIEHTISIEGIMDISGNIINPILHTFIVYSKPNENDIKLSEILFNPIGDGSDYVELYNNSNKWLDLSLISIGNLDNNSFSAVGFSILDPKSYVVFTEDSTDLIETYKPLTRNNINLLKLPAFNNDEGTPCIKFEDEIFEQYHYSEDQHHPLINDPEGISLERVNYELSASLEGNWSSSSVQYNYGTPGFENSNKFQLSNNDNFTLNRDFLSPNQDGIEDFVRIEYSLLDLDNVLTLKIYDSEGQLIKTLANNKLIGSQGFISWDGTNDDGQKARNGIYLLIGEYFNTKGEVNNIKKTISLLDYIK